MMMRTVGEHAIDIEQQQANFGRLSCAASGDRFHGWTLKSGFNQIVQDEHAERIFGLMSSTNKAVIENCSMTATASRRQRFSGDGFGIARH